jgi:hypothetical protein
LPGYHAIINAMAQLLRHALSPRVTLTVLAVLCAQAAFGAPLPATPRSGLPLAPCRVEGVREELRCGIHEVFENRRTRTGRKLPLKVVVIPARQPHPGEGPSSSSPAGRASGDRVRVVR